MSNILEKIKSWFKYSTTLLLARATMLVGFLTAVFATIDWSPLMMLDWSTGFDWDQALKIGVGLFLQGMLIEWTRRRSLDA